MSPGQQSVRGEAVTSVLERLDPDRDWEAKLAVVAGVLADALVRGDAETLAEIAETMREKLARLFDARGASREVRGYLLALLTTTRLALEELPDPYTAAIAPDTHSALALRALAAEGPLGSAELRERLGTGASQLSRVGRQLLAAGLVVQRRAGRTATWEITPRGRDVVSKLVPAASKRQAR